MPRPDMDDATRRRVLFVSRDPILHEMSGSTSYALRVLEQLLGQGARVTMLVTLAQSRSPRVWFRTAVEAPAGLEFRVPGYLRVGRWYVRPWAPGAWARLARRVAAKKTAFRWIDRVIARVFGERVFDRAWDLTQPTAGEAAWVQQWVQQQTGAAVLLNYAFWAPAADQWRDAAAERPRMVILMHDLLSARVEGFLKRGAALDCPQISRAEEISWLRRADCLLVAQEREAAEIAPEVRGQVMVPAVMFPVRPSGGAPAPGRCLLVATDIMPNRASLQFLAEQVWPLVRQRFPQATLAVVGSLAQRVDAAMAENGVLAVGKVPDLTAEYAQAAVVLAPLVMGTGIKIKLLEALSFGKALVATPIGVEGLETQVGGAVLVAEDAAAFAEAVCRVLGDEALRKRMEAGALQIAEQRNRELQAFAQQMVEAFFRN